MNEVSEFIGWSKKDNKFLDKDDLCFVEMGSYSSILLDVLNGTNKDVNIFDFIKKDTTGNKIYADSSIVEFNWVTKYIGFFQWDEDNLRYVIRILKTEVKNSMFDSFDFDMYSMSDFKIIDTIQENKLGLYDAKN